jgi:ABC-type branched-subunit amino acid transport system ATPase component
VALRQDGLTTLMIEHELDVVERICDRVIVMAQGRVLTSGSMREVRGSREVQDAYIAG